MQLGNFQLTTISGGRYWIDGGTMFGVVPRKLWARVFPPDDQNRIAQATNCVLVQTGDQNVLIDTGYGSKLDEKQRRIFDAEAGDPLIESLHAQGLSAEQIDVVVLSHLHFDHAGGATQRHDGRLKPTFPQARYVVQRREWVNATAEYPELRGAYPPENLLPLSSLKDSGRLQFIDGDGAILPGIRTQVTGGHTEGHQAIFIESGGEAAVFLGDLCPSSRHLPTLWNMAYDVDTLQTRRTKPALLGQIADNGWWALLDHDPDAAAIRIQRDPQRDFIVTDSEARL
jgi:glyoxylase-like metal-dependent hydrolase (beta-lactamase superfamily II)